MIRPAGGNWTQWTLNVATVLAGAALNVIGSAIDAAARCRRIG